MPGEKNALYLSVNVFTTQILIEQTIFKSPNGDGTALLSGHPLLKSSRFRGKGDTFISQSF